MEVLCKLGAFVVKRCASGVEKPSHPQVTWSRYGGPHAAWDEACKRAGVAVAVAVE